jgi:uncharacterized pyridoxamine 5'-phosphate oxidase family protein
MADRPHISMSYIQLKSLFDENLYDLEILKSISYELSFRKTRSAKALATEINKIFTEEESASNSVQDVSAVYEVEGQLDEIELSINEILPTTWDKDQRTVIEYDSEDNVVVEAGPGAGKTAVACARVANLIENDGLEASKILLISFTRAAIKEIRDRIKAYASDPLNIAGLQIMTLDSFTWHIVKGITDMETEDLFSSYQGNIERLLDILKKRNPDLIDHLNEFEHVIVDEGQDLVSMRAELVVEILKNIPRSCGVTVFSDSAQAIYGFTDDSEEHLTHRSLTAVERISKGDVHGFSSINLNNVHRTKDLKLKKLFKHGRQRVLGRIEGTVDSWKEMKELISSLAHGTVDSVEKQDLNGKSDHLVLFRTRAEVLMGSSFLWDSGVAHKIRMSGIPSQVHPWIGRLLGEFTEDFLSRNEFEKLWFDRIDSIDNLSNAEVSAAWELLYGNVGDAAGRIRLTRLREILSRERPPLDFIVDEKEIPGPVLGTIHASKGREANQVHLMLPPDSFIDNKRKMDPHEFAEEERVLFVGASRARLKLMTGKGKKLYSRKVNNKRVFRRTPKGAYQIEVGLQHDLNPISLVDGNISYKEALNLQNWLWTNKSNIVDLYSLYDFDAGVNRLFLKQEDRYLVSLNKYFGSDLFSIANMVKDRYPLKPQLKINNIRMTGITTVTVTEGNRDQLTPPWRHSRFLLAPVISGFPSIYYKKR